MGSKMNRMVLLFMLILSMVSLPTSLPKHLLVETADKGGDDYSRPSPIPSFFPPHDYSRQGLPPPRPPPFFPSRDYSMGQQDEGQDYGRLSAPRPHPPRPRPSPRPNPWTGGWGRGGSGNIVGR